MSAVGAAFRKLVLAFLLSDRLLCLLTSSLASQVPSFKALPPKFFSVVVSSEVRSWLVTKVELGNREEIIESFCSDRIDADKDSDV
jgi:hypothetical protein